MKLHLSKEEYYYYEPLPVREFSGNCMGTERTWKEYIPGSYDPSNEYPLVISLHGGPLKPGQVHTGEKTNAFTHVAEKYGFIVVFAQSISEYISWDVWDIYSAKGDPQYQNDVVYLDWLIDTVCEKYNINKCRIYLYGHSLGDVMATEYCLKRSGRLAAAALCCGPSNASGFMYPDGSWVCKDASPIPVLRLHGSEDMTAPSGRWPHVSDGKLYECSPVRALIDRQGGVTDDARKLKMELTQVPNILLWNSVDHADGKVSFSVSGSLNIAAFSGEQPFYYLFEQDGGHFPPVYMAEYIWKYFFSNFANCSGVRRRLASEYMIGAGADAMIFAVGAEKMVSGNVLAGLDHKIAEKDGAAMISAEDAENFFPAASAMLAGTDSSARINNIDYLPIEMCAKLSGLCLAASRGVVYISENTGVQLTYDMTYLIKVYLGVERMPTAKECFELEKTELEKSGYSVPEYPGR